MTRNLRSQSAMEYLMTYGWAILIIAVVLGALFQLGVFSGIGTPKAQPGNCQVVKVGSGITQTISLAGQCQGQEPEYVTVFDNPLTSNYPGNPQSYVDIPSSTGLPGGSAPRSVFAWIYLNSNQATDTPAQCQLNFGNCWYVIVDYGNGGCANGIYFILFGYNGAPGLDVSLDTACYQWQSSLVVPDNTWEFVGMTYAGANTVTFYEDGQSNTVVQSTYPVNTNLPSSIYIGANKGGGSSGGFPGGSIVNVQIYNTSLSSSEASALYYEGIGGAPIDPQHLVGWWPLNGNAKDYSGNNNDGTTKNVIYSSSWTSGYTAP